MATSTATFTASDHIRSAISALESEIAALEELGIREGSIAQSPTSRGGIQYHWCNGGKRVYVSKKLEPQYRAEIERGREVAGIVRRIEMLKELV